jgi:hypothetical protein
MGKPLAEHAMATNPAEQLTLGGAGKPILGTMTADPVVDTMGSVYEGGMDNGMGLPSSGGGGPAYGHSSPAGFSSGFDTANFVPNMGGGGTYGDYGGGQGGGYGGGSSGGYQEQVRVPGGSAAGPFETAAASNRPYEAERALGSGYGGGSSGGGGGGASDAYWNLRNKLSGAFGDDGGGYSSGGYPSSSGYGSSDPLEPRIRKNAGFSKKYNEEALNETIGLNPHAVLPRVMTPGEVGYDWVRGMDAGGIMELGAGTKGKGWMTKDRVNKYGYVTPGVLNQNKYTNNLGQMYTDMQSGGSGWLDQQTALNNLLGAKKKSYVGSQFGNKVSIIDQANSANRYLQTIADMGPDISADAYMYAAQADIDTWQEQALRKKKPGSVTKYLKSRGW